MYRPLSISVPPYLERAVEAGVSRWVARRGASLSPPSLVQVRWELVLLQRETPPGPFVVAYERELPVRGIEHLLKDEILNLVDLPFAPHPERASITTDRAAIELTFADSFLVDWKASNDEVVHEAVRAYFPAEVAQTFSHILQRLHLPHISAQVREDGLRQGEKNFARRYGFGIKETLDMFFGYVAPPCNLTGSTPSSLAPHGGRNL